MIRESYSSHTNSETPPATYDHLAQSATNPEHGGDRSQFPPGYTYNPDILETAEEQIAHSWEEYDYQSTPNPSFDEVPAIDITPTFNPSNAPIEKFLIRGWSPDSLRLTGWKPHSEHTHSDHPLTIWRFVVRSSLIDGTGITSSSTLEGMPIEDHRQLFMHLASNQELRTGDKATPFVSFSTDPKSIASIFTAKEFGSKDGRDTVVIQATVDPDRVLSHGHNKEEEVLLLGGLGPHEYDKAMEVEDFIRAATKDQH